MKTTGHEKSWVSVCLAARADGTKLKPFDGAKSLQSFYRVDCNQCINIRKIAFDVWS